MNDGINDMLDILFPKKQFTYSAGEVNRFPVYIPVKGSSVAFLQYNGFQLVKFFHGNLPDRKQSGPSTPV